MNSLRVLLILLCVSVSVMAENNPYHSDVVWVTTPNHNNWLYEINQDATVTVAVYLYGQRQTDLLINYEIGPDMLPADRRGEVHIRDGQAVIPFGTMRQPGFRDLRLQTTIDGVTYQHHIKLGFSVSNITPYTKMPNDFTDFWQQQIETANQVPMEVERVRVAEFSNNSVDCYLVKLQAYKHGHYIYGYLTVPKGDGKYPAVFSPPGAGIKPMTPEKDLFYAEQGMIRFDMEIHGIRPDLDKETYASISRAFGSDNNSYLVNGLDNPENYYMKKAYLSSLRVLDYLTSLPQWDGKNLIAQGGSQGGAIALVATALDPRITAVAANHPALSDMAAYKDNRAGGYPHLFTRFSGMDTPEKLKTLPYYDVVNFARLIDVPVLMTWGFNDDICPPTTSYAVYNSIKSEKHALVTPANEHWISKATRHKIADWIKTTLH